jgi:hypothetical protein
MIKAIIDLLDKLKMYFNSDVSCDLIEENKTIQSFKKEIVTLNENVYDNLHDMFESIKKNYRNGMSHIIQTIPKPPIVTPVTPVTPSLYIPFAKQYKTPMKSHGKYRKGYPEFALIHHTAGREGTGTIEHGIKSGFLYLYIDRNGDIYQTNPLNEWGSHAGVSSKEGYEGNVSRYCVGIEISGAGKLEQVTLNGVRRYKAWFHRNERDYFFEKDVRYTSGTAEKTKGFYHKFTVEQEDSLVKLLSWLWRNNPKVFNLEHTTGHENVAPRRKNDPSASLSMTMAELISKVKSYG